MNINPNTETIAFSASTTSGPSLNPKSDQQPMALRLPAFPTAVSATFEVSYDNGNTWAPLKALGGASNYQITVGNTVSLLPLPVDLFYAVRQFRMILNAADSGTVTVYRGALN